MRSARSTQAPPVEPGGGRGWWKQRCADAAGWSQASRNGQVPPLRHQPRQRPDGGAYGDGVVSAALAGGASVQVHAKCGSNRPDAQRRPQHRPRPGVSLHFAGGVGRIAVFASSPESRDGERHTARPACPNSLARYSF